MRVNIFYIILEIFTQPFYSLQIIKYVKISNNYTQTTHNLTNDRG
jgi:hypothetical protein